MGKILGMLLLILGIATATPVSEPQKYVVDGYAGATTPAGMPFHAGNEADAFDAAGIKLIFPGSAGADGTVQRMKSRQSDATFWAFQAIRATANDTACLRIIWLLQSRSDMELVSKANSWSALTQFVREQKNAMHLVGGLDRPNTAYVESAIAEHKLGTREQNIDGSEEARALFFLRNPSAAVVELAQPWASGMKHVEGMSAIDNYRSDLLQGTALDAIAVRCDDLKPGSPMREVHKKVLEVLIKEARWIKDPANKPKVVSWIADNLERRQMIQKLEANKGERKMRWETNDHLAELAENVYDLAVPAVADSLPPDALARVRKTVGMALGVEPPENIDKYVDLSLAQEIQRGFDKQR